MTAINGNNAISIFYRKISDEAEAQKKKLTIAARLIPIVHMPENIRPHNRQSNGWYGYNDWK